MNTNYLAVISCAHCGEMIITKPDGTIFCACTTQRSCKHPEGMGDCHECTISDLERQLADEKGITDTAIRAMQRTERERDTAQADYKRVRSSLDTAVRLKLRAQTELDRYNAPAGG